MMLAQIGLYLSVIFVWRPGKKSVNGRSNRWAAGLPTSGNRSPIGLLIGERYDTQLLAAHRFFWLIGKR